MKTAMKYVDEVYEGLTKKAELEEIEEIANDTIEEKTGAVPNTKNRKMHKKSLDTIKQLVKKLDNEADIMDSIVFNKGDFELSLNDKAISNINKTTKKLVKLIKKVVDDMNYEIPKQEFSNEK